MSSVRKENLAAIPVVDGSSSRVVGGFCTNREAVTEQELAALAMLRQLHGRATALKARLASAAPEEKALLQEELAELRREADYWRQQREAATEAKHKALGHVQLSLDG